VSWSAFLWRNLSRNKVRSLLTGGAIALAIALVCFLATMPDGMNRILEQVATNTRIVVHNEAGIVYPMPYAYMQKVRSMPGVVAATSWTWFGGVFKEEDGVSFPNFAIEPDAVGETWPDYNIAKDQLEEFKRRRDGAIVGHGTLARYGWKIGDDVTLKSTVFPVDLTFKIVGEIPNERAPHFWFQREYLDQALAASNQPNLFQSGSGSSGRLDLLGEIWVRVDDPARIDPLMREIDSTFRNSEAQTSTENEKSYFKNFFGALEGLVFLIILITALVAVCIVFIAANTASMTVRERMREIAILKAMGFRRRTVFGMLVAEAGLLATLAGAIGAFSSLGLSQLVRHAAGSWNPAMGPLASFIVTNTILVEGLFLAFFIGMLSGVVPSYGAARRGVVQTLREVF
jgi:putative ABC transport system permease protein